MDQQYSFVSALSVPLGGKAWSKCLARNMQLSYAHGVRVFGKKNAA